MKNRIISAFFALLLLISTFSGCSAGTKANGNKANVDDIIGLGTAENDVDSIEYVKVAENDFLELHFNKNTTHFKVINKKDGKQYSSLPNELLDGSVGANSLLELSYMTETGTIVSMSSFNDSVKKGQYKVEEIENGVKILFTLGNVSEKLFCPTAFTEDRFDEISSKIKKSFDKVKFKNSYYKCDIEEITDSKERSELLSKYPKLKDEKLFILKNEEMSLSLRKQIHNILISIGYTDKDYEKDTDGIKQLEEKNYPVFNIALYLKLENDGLKISVPTKEIQEYNGGKLLSIDLIKYFAAPSPGTEGYFLLPDASGSKMNFYNGKNDKSAYNVHVYGNDKSIKIDERIYHQDVAYLPMFANVTKSGAVLTEIIGSESNTIIKASPGDSSVHAVAYPSFQFRQVSQTYLDSASKEQGDFFYLTQDKIYNGDMALKLIFFDAENANLDSLAKRYRKDIFDKDRNLGEQPLMLDFIGVDSIDTVFMGVSQKKEKVFTTINQVLEILKEFKSNGVDKMQVRLSGFFKNGYVQPFAANLKLNSKVGTEEDLNNLKKWADENNTKLYFDVDIQYVYNTKSFNKRKNVVSLINKEIGKNYDYNLATFQLDTTGSFRYILNSGAIGKSVDHVLELNKKLGTGFSLRNIGSDINSDFNKKAAVERQESLEKLVNQVSRVSKETDIITKGANAPILPYVLGITDVPMRSLQFDICDEVVPFLQMVINGNVYYSDEPRNLSGDTRSSLLDTIRTGGALNFTLTANESLSFTKTVHKDLTSTKYSVWKDKILEEYKLLDSLKEHTVSGIKDSVLVKPQLYRTDYNDGTSIIINYSSEQQQYNEKIVEPLGFIIVGKEN